MDNQMNIYRKIFKKGKDGLFGEINLSTSGNEIKFSYPEFKKLQMLQIRAKNDPKLGKLVDQLELELVRMRSKLTGVKARIEKYVSESEARKKFQRNPRTRLHGAINNPKINSEIKRLFLREGIEYTEEELPRLKELAFKFYGTIPEPEHIMHRAEQEGILLNSDQVTKICWVIHAFYNVLDKLEQRYVEAQQSLPL